MTTLERKVIRAIYSEVPKVMDADQNVNVLRLAYRVAARGVPVDHVAQRLWMMVRAAEMTEVSPGIYRWVW